MTLPDTWYYEVRARTGWPCVSIVWLTEIASLMCNFFLNVAAHTLLQSDLPQRYTLIYTFTIRSTADAYWYTFLQSDLPQRYSLIYTFTVRSAPEILIDIHFYNQIYPRDTQWYTLLQSDLPQRYSLIYTFTIRSTPEIHNDIHFYNQICLRDTHWYTLLQSDLWGECVHLYM